MTSLTSAEKANICLSALDSAGRHDNTLGEIELAAIYDKVAQQLTDPERINVDKGALFLVLNALNGQPHYIRELRATRNLPKLGNAPENPINILVRNYEGQV